MHIIHPEHPRKLLSSKNAGRQRQRDTVMSEAMKYAYADRSQYLCDPDFILVPAQDQISKAYAKTLVQRIDLNYTRPLPPFDLSSCIL